MNTSQFAYANLTAGAFAQFLSMQAAEKASVLCTKDVQITYNSGSGKNQKTISVRDLIRENRFYLLNSPLIYEKDDVLTGEFFIFRLDIQNGCHILRGIKAVFTFVSDDLSDTSMRISSLVMQELPPLSEEKGAAVCEADVSLRKTILSENLSSAVVSDENAGRLIRSEQAASKALFEAISPDSSTFELYFSPCFTCSGDSQKGMVFSLRFSYISQQDVYLPSLYVRQLELRGEDVLTLSEEKAASLAPLAPSPALPPGAADMIRRNLAVPLERPVCSFFSEEDLMKIRTRGVLWTYGIRSYDPSLFIENSLDRDAPDLLVEILRPVSGYKGFEEQFALMERMKKLQPDCQGIHSQTTPYIVRTSPDTAVCYWLDFGWTMMGKVFGNDTDLCPVLPDIGRYILKMRKKDDQWKVYELHWSPLLQYGSWSFNRAL